MKFWGLVMRAQSGESIMNNKISSVLRKSLVGLAALLVLSSVSIAQQNRTRVFRMQHLDVQKAKAHLEKLNIAEKINEVAGRNTIVVTASAENLKKAKGLLETIDSSSEFIVNSLAGVRSSDKKLYSEAVVKLQADNIAVGTLAMPSASKSLAKVIIDSVGEKVYVVAPKELKSKIEAAFNIVQKVEKQVINDPNQPVAEQPKETKTSDDELEKSLAELAKTPVVENVEVVDESPKTDEPIVTAAKETLGEVATNEEVVVETESKTEKEMPEDLLAILAAVAPEMIEEVKKVSATELPQDEVAQEKESSVDSKLPTPVAQADETKEKIVSKDTYTDSLEIEEAEKELELTITLPEKVELTALLELVGKQLGLNYIFDPKKVTGQVMLKVHDGKIKLKDTYALLESVLSFRGFVMTRRGSLVTIVPIAEAAKIDPRIVGENEKIKPGEVVITSVFQLENITTEMAKSVLKSMQLGDSIIDIPDNKTLIVTGYAYRMDHISKLLELVDVKGEKREIESRQLEFTEAAALVTKIQTLAEQLGTVQVSVGAAAPKTTSKRTVRRDSKGKVIPNRKTAAGATVGAEKTKGVFLDVDERTNRILMIGTAKDIATVNSLIDSFDVPKKDLRFVRQYQLEYVDAGEVRDKLTELGIISGSGYSSSSSRTSRTNTKTNTRTSQTNRPSTKTNTSSATSQPDTDEPQVVILENTNSLLVNATPEQHDKIIDILSYIDSRPIDDAMPVKIYSLENQDPEAMAETLDKLISEVVQDKEGNIEKKVKKQEGITIVPDPQTFSMIVYASKRNQEWIGSLIHDLDKRRPQILLDATLVEISNTDKFKYDLQLAAKDPMSAGGSMDKLTSIVTPFVGDSREMTSMGGTIKGFYSDDNVQLLFEAMEDKSYGRVLAQPSILVNDNEEGMINSEVTRYVARISTTGSGDSNLSQESVSFEEYPSGITLTITPHISEGELLRLEINLVRSNQSGASEQIINGKTYSAPADKTQNDITTIVTVPDANTIILGGILQLDQSKGGGKVPILGDIPLIGGLFRSIDNTNTENKLYVFVRAKILRPEEGKYGLPELEEISQRRRDAFEKSEDDFQKYEDFPGLDQKALEPKKVLDWE